MDFEAIRWFGETYGLPGLAIAYLVIENRRLRKENAERVESELKTLREVLPSIQILSNALDVVKGRIGE